MALLDDLFGNHVQPGVAPLNDEAAEKKFPILYDLLNRRTYSDGTARCPPTLVIRRVAGAVEVVLQEHDFLQQKVASSKTLEGVFKALEKALSDPEVPWREYKSKVPTPLKKARDRKKS